MKIEQSIGDPAFLVEEYYDTMQENDALKNRVRNLELYLDYVKQKAPKLWEEMNEEFCNLPGQTVKMDEMERFYEEW